MSIIINEKIEKVNKVVAEIENLFNEPKKRNINVSYKFPKEHKEHKKIYECSKSLFTTILQHNQTKDIKKNISFFACKSKFCPVCNKIKSGKFSKAVYNKATELQAEGQRFLFLTLTIKNIDISDTDKTIKNMNRAWRDLWRRYLSKQFNGFIKILEITFPNGKEAHPHFHILLSANRNYFFKSNLDYLTTERISELWGRVLKVDYKPIVDIRVIKPKKGKQGITKEAIPAVIAEMAKYPMKDTDYDKLSEDTMALLYSELYRKRLIATGGNLKISINKIDNDLSIKEIDEQETDQWQKIAYIVMKYLKGGYVLAGGDFY